MLQHVNSGTQPILTHVDSAIQTPADMDSILLDPRRVSGSLGEFLRDLFQYPSKGRNKGPEWSQRHTQMVAKFLQGRTNLKAEDLVDLIYRHPEAVPKAAWSNAPYPAHADKLQRANGSVER
jgi:hypothetical protein